MLGTATIDQGYKRDRYEKSGGLEGIYEACKVISVRLYKSGVDKIYTSCVSIIIIEI